METGTWGVTVVTGGKGEAGRHRAELATPSDIHWVLAILLIIAAATWSAVEEPPEGELEEGVKGLIPVVDPLQVALVGLAGS